VPALIADLGDEAAWRYVEFFTANIRNPHTRRAYSRASNRFFACCEECGLMPAAIRPHDVVTYIEQLQAKVSAPSVKQQLAAVRMLFDWLVIGQVVPANPAAAVRGPKHVVKTSRPARRRSSKAPRGANCSSRSRRRRCAICAIGHRSPLWPSDLQLCADQRGL
jgi:Phage integrase, N-terminal SAM-like domain